MSKLTIIIPYCFFVLSLCAFASPDSSAGGISSAGSTITADYAVIIDDIVIPYKIYSQTLKEASSKMQLTKGANLASTENNRLMFMTKKSIIDDLINQYLTQRGAKKLGVQVTEKEINAQLKAIKSSYKNENDFLADLEAEGIALPEIIANISTQLIKEKITKKLLENIAVSKTEIANYLAQAPGRGKDQEKRLIRHIVVNDKETAINIRKRYFAGESFAGLATIFSTDVETVESGGNLGYIDLAMIPEKAQKDVRRLKKGEITRVIEIDNKFYIFQIGDIIELNQNKQEALRTYLLREKQEEFFAKWLERQKNQSQITINPELKVYYLQDFDPIIPPIKSWSTSNNTLLP